MSDRLLKGVGVSPGLAVGPAVIVRSTIPDVPHRVVPRAQVEKEVRRLHAAIRDVKRHLGELKAKAEVRAGVDEARIFDAQVLMLEDREFIAGAETLIRENHLTAERAFEFKALEVRDMWAATGNPRLKDRLTDFTGVTTRVIDHLLHRGLDEVWNALTRPSVLVAHELGPGLTVQFDRKQVIGLVSEEGTRTSHAAILAHSIGIPAVFGVTGALDRIGPGTMLIMDGTRGTVLLSPTAAEISEAEEREQRRRALGTQLEEVRPLPAVTTDGTRVALRGNVDLPDEIRPAQEQRAEGVGLLRTEFLITSHDT
ncbi:MAG TPA: phosphoenolpyruvate-utilizing N-terminal domain-containing protein, partial [Gemmatimonadales bacterium]|nr:phosphoenolpyruvate-utilizing N-terminal domain-containing protein [Gemmatimonadales bacterium]